MRIIPKKTNVEMEFFKGIGVVDMLVLGIGGSLAFSLLLSDLPFHLILFIITLTATVAIVVPVDDEKAYQGIFYALKYIARFKRFVRAQEGDGQKAKEESKAKSKIKLKSRKTKTPDAASIVPFTGFSGEFIEYGNSYSGLVVEIPSVEFRFLSEERQDNLIDRVLGGILRSVTMGETASLVKIDRPLLYDDVLRSEQEKMAALKESYLNGLLSEDELTRRIGIIYDRMAMIQNFNEVEKVYVPFHYLVFYHKNRELLKEQAQNAVQYLGSNDMDCHILKGAELAVFLKYQYIQTFDEREVNRLKPDEYMDWIMPKEIRFTPRTTVFDGLITHTLKVTKYPTLVGNAWGSQLFNIPGTKVVMKIKPMDRYKSVRQIDRAIDELREQESHTGKASRIMEIGTHIETLGEVLRLLQGDNETLFKVNLYVTVFDYDLSHAMAAYTGKKGEKKPVGKRKKEVKRNLSEWGFRSSDMMMQQFEAYASTAVSANDALTKSGQSIHSSSIAAAFPYVYKLLNDKGGIYLGNSGGVPAFVNFFLRNKERVNSNMVIIGKSGSGKSYATKTILTHLAAEDTKIFILDPENEYLEMAKNFNGKIIDVGSATQGRLNPFHIITNLSDEEGEDEAQAANTSYNTHLQFLEEFYRQILPGIESDALEYLNNITSRMYEEKGIDGETDLSTLSPADFPTFDDLYEKILNDFQLSTGEYSKKNLRVLLNYISKFATGGRNSNLWNGEASISTKENFIVFNFQSLLANKNNTIANAQMLLVLKWLDNEIIKNRDYNIRYHGNRKIVVVIDEAHVFIDSKYPIALDFMFQLAKRIRKYNGMQIVITQNIKDFVGTEELARKSTAIINASQYSFIFPLAPNDMHDLCRLYEKAGAINESEQNDIINNGRGRAFVITSPSERTCVDIVAGKDIEQLFTM